MKLRLDTLAFAAILLLCSVFARSQTVSPIGALGTLQAFDNNGKPCTACVLYSFQAGTSTQQATYTDSTGVIANPNPIPFGGSGARVNIWLSSGQFYKFQLCVQNDGPTCAPADVLFSVDQVPGSGGAGSSGSPFIGTFISGSPTPASTGILRLASGDQICWRNQANSGNLCFSKDTSDVLEWAGGVFKMPEIGCSNSSTGFDYLCADSGAHRFKMAANGGSQLVLAVQGVDINSSDQVTQLHFGSTPTPLNASTPPTTGQYLIWDGANISGLTPPTIPPTDLHHYITTLGSPVTLGGAGSPSTILTQAVTMPTSGCPCRALVHYQLYLNGSTNGSSYNSWVNDGTSSWASAQTYLDASGRQGGLGTGAMSENTYTNSAVITFTLKAQNNVSGNGIAAASAAGAPQNTWMTVDIITSN